MRAEAGHRCGTGASLAGPRAVRIGARRRSRPSRRPLWKTRHQGGQQPGTPRSRLRSGRDTAPRLAVAAAAAACPASSHLLGLLVIDLQVVVEALSPGCVRLKTDTQYG